MKKLLVLLVAVALPVIGHAKGSNFQRGGFGYLFPDANSTANPAQFAKTGGAALQASYARNNDATPVQSATPTFVWGNGKVGFGAEMTRAGSDFTTDGSYVDQVKGGIGFALGSAVTIGGSYSKVITSGSTTPDSLAGFVALNPGKGKGFGLTAGYGQTLNTATPTKSAVGALGFMFNANSNIEGGAEFNNIDDFSDYDLFGALTIGNGKVYGAARFDYAMLSTDMTAQGRLGFMLGQKVDLSGQVSKVFNAAGDGALSFGGTFRVAF